VITKFAHRSYHLAAGAAAMVVVVATAGCAALLDAQHEGPQALGSVTLTEHVAPSLLVVVSGPGEADPLAGRVIAATARPREDLVLEAEGRGRAVVASDSPPPVTLVVRGRPVPPGRGASSYQQGRYRAALGHWRGQVAATRRLVMARTRAAVAAWARGLRLPTAAGSSSASLAAEAARAADAVSGLVNQAGARFGTRRVVLLSVSSLAGMPSLGELGGDDVIVISSSLPTAVAANAAQANLLAAGAVRAAVLGTEVTPALVEHLVAEGLSQSAVTESLSGRALFANDSSALLPTATAVLAPLIGPLRRPGAMGIVNGYASAIGNARHNLALSWARAAAVVAFLEASGVPSLHLSYVGHGATNLVAPGASGDNRRVVVVIEEPVSGSY
jgi:outer membrane protein OmpA-like peptidoglycan-associated protein